MSVLRNIHIGASGLTAANAALSAVSHNVVNATTPGFQRRGVQQSTAAPTLGLGLLAGRGVRVEGFRRMGSDLITRQQVLAEGDLAAATARQDALAPLEPVLDETQLAGPHQAVAAFFDALQQATQDPSDSALRRVVVSRAKGVERSMARTAATFDQTLDGQAEALDARVERLNEVARSLAEVNRNIIAQDAPGDLLDERDRLLKEAGALAGATADIQVDGTANLLLGGHAVVSRADARTVSLTDSFRLAVDAGRGDVEVDAGGEIGGWIDARTTTTALRERLSEAARAFADAINQAHASGYDRNGSPGADLFLYDATDPAGSLTVSAAIDADPDRLAFASDPSAHAGDGGNLDALTAVERQPLVGNATVLEALSTLTGDLASELAAARAETEHGARVLDDLDQIQANLAGVDLDEEAANLLLYQTAYQASAKVVQVNDDLIDTLLEMA